MKRIFSLFAAMLFCAALFATDYYYRGTDNKWGTGIKLELSEDGYYYFYSIAAGMTEANEFKIFEEPDNWSATQYNGNNVSRGFNLTDIDKTAGDGGMGSKDGGDVWIYNTTACFILLYPAGTDINKSDKAIICAATFLPKNDGPIEDVTLYFVNDCDWTTINAYPYAGETPYKTWPGEAMTKTEEKANEKDIYSYTFPEIYTKIIFNNKVGEEGVQTGDLEWNADKPYYSFSHRAWYATADDVPAPVKYYITGDSALVAEAGFPGKKWESDAIKATEDSYTFINLAAGDYKLKVCVDGTWNTAKGFDDLTTIPVGVYTDKAADRDVAFTLEEAGNVTVTYTSSEFTIEGNFALRDITVKGNRLPEPTVVMVTDKAAKTASATITLTDEQVGEGIYYSFIIGLSKEDFRSRNYQFNRDYDNIENLLSRTKDSLQFRADFAGEYKIIWNYANNGLSVAFPKIPDARYYIAGDLTDWSDTTKMARMVENEGVWTGYVTLEAANYKFKIHRWQGPYQAIYGAQDEENEMTSTNCTDWKLVSPGQDINLNASEEGQYTFRFTPGDENDLDVEYPEATAVENTAVEGKAVKSVKNGQLVIIKNGVKYNVVGAIIK